MKKMLSVLVAALICLSFAGVSLAGEQTVVTKDLTKKPSVKKERLVSAKATVEAIDPATRIVTLKGPKGKIFDVHADEKVRNFAQVKIGDKVHVKFYQSVAVSVMAPGKAPGGIQETATVEKAKPGEKPGVVVDGQYTVTAKVETIDAKKKSVTLKGPAGKTLDVVVKDPKNLENVKVGDEVVITVTEARAVFVDSAK
jgi:preprotein translocase subunit YajC